MVRLPGKLTNLSGVKRARNKDALGLALEIIGFVAMFVVFPWGLLGGAVLVWLGWRRTYRWVCENCNTSLKSRWEEACPGCRTKFGTG